MSVRRSVWFVIAVLFVLLNVGGAVVAIAEGEGAHTGIHLSLAVLGAVFGCSVIGGRRSAR